MKTKLIFTLLLTFPFFLLSSQIPQGFNYQAVARNSSGLPIINQALPVMITIQSDSSGGEMFWKELHSSLKTNDLGVINLVIGKGVRQSSSTVASFSGIDWSNTPKFLKIDIDFNGWKTLGVSRLWSVPYSLIAGDLAGSVKKLAVEGQTSGPEEALFEVKNRDGQTVFAVYNEGVRVYVSDGAKAVKGGFAVGGFGTDKSESTKYLFVGKDSVRIYLDTNPLTKAVKSGFAVGGYDLTKGKVQDYLNVNSDSVRIYIDNNPNSKKTKGGFAVGGFDATKGAINNFLDLTPKNYFIGHNSGKSVTTGLYNSFLGYESGFNVSSGGSNAFLGYQSGYNNSSGSSNLFLGYKSGYSNTSGNYNTFVGYNTGYSNTGGINNTFLGSFTGQNNSTGSYNVFIGDSSGLHNINGVYNSFIGTKAGVNNITGFSNTFIGNFTGHENTTGYENVFIGNFSGYSNSFSAGNVIIGNRAGYLSSKGWNNVYIGTETGYNNIDGAGNVFIGYKTGINNLHGSGNIFIGNFAGGNQQGSDKLYIDNKDADSSSVFIFGNLMTDQLRLNSKVGIGTNPGWHNLTVYNNWGRGSVNIKGKGDIYEYASLSLESDSMPGSNSYIVSHGVNHSFLVNYFNGKDWFQRMNIDSLGKVAINNFNSGTETLDVNGNARFRGVGSGTFAYNLNITSDGTLTTSSSDISMKENISQITDALEHVIRLKGVTFTWKNDTTKARQIGMIAQEVESVVPEIVFTNQTDGLKGINYSQATALLVEAIKEQQNQIESAKQENIQIKSELNELKALFNKFLADQPGLGKD